MIGHPRKSPLFPYTPLFRSVVPWGGRVRLLVYPPASPTPRRPPPARPGRSPPAAPEQTGGQLCPYAGGGGGVPEPVAGGVADGSPCFARPKSLAIPRIVAGLTENDAVRLVRNGENSDVARRSEEHTSELQSRLHLVCRLLLEKKKKHQ